MSLSTLIVLQSFFLYIKHSISAMPEVTLVTIGTNHKNNLSRYNVMQKLKITKANDITNTNIQYKIKSVCIC